MDVEWKNLNIELKNKNKSIAKKYVKLVKNAYGEAKAGELCAIMGPSGSGKTTLLKALAGRIPDGGKTTGIVTSNKLERRNRDWINNIAFVDQDDCCYENLTVRQTITYAAKFRLKDKSVKINDKVDTIISNLYLKKIANTRIKSISGGERKRTMIGVELVTDPKIILLDEPTSGLDSSYALDLIRLFKEIAEKKLVTIIFTIHQPSYEIFLLFNRLVLLFDGNTVYNSTANEFKTKAESFGFLKREFCLEPEFAIDILKFREEYNEIPENLTNVNEMIKQTLENQEEFKITQPSTSNMFYNGFFPNFYHIFVLLERRFRLYFLGKKGLKYLLYFLCSMILFSLYNSESIYYKWRIFGVNALMNVLIQMDETKKINFAWFLKDNSEPLIKKEFQRIIITLLMINAQLVFSSIFNGSVSHSFVEERDRVKREIGVQSYTTISYFTSIFLYHIFLNVLSSILFIVIFKIHFGDFLYNDFYLFSSLSFFGLLPLLLLYGTMANNTAFASILNIVMSICTTVSPQILALIHFYLKEKVKFKGIKVFRMFAFFPFYDLRYIFSIKFLNSIDTNIFSDSKHLPFLQTTLSDLKYILGNFFEIEDISVGFMSGVFFLMTASIIFISIILLNQFLRPEMRFKLQEKPGKKNKV
ncbi:putative ABC transporter [Hamiltosporidium tvaerminnensis]|uniref:Putative ABC transporter n=1 Tax=Hamiltosporidium tvaerminnensis TaxID=1176355 RepID=A0A4Q9L4X7_9MICR|nr:putative ABC transporter [Hamiltosporidium tvaerminnensis]